MVSEKVAAVMLVVAIILAILSIAITINVNENFNINLSGSGIESLNAGNVQLVVESQGSIENESGGSAE